jgi:hypothetical protein
VIKITPIKCFRKHNLELYTEDMAGIRQLICTAANEMQLLWLISSLEAFHRRHTLDWDEEYAKH